MMGIDDPATDRPIDQRRDSKPETEAMVDASALALAATFGAVAFPPDMPDHIKDAILKRAEQAREAAGPFVIDNNRPSKNSDRDASEERDDALMQLTQMLQQQRREAESEAAWLASSHSYAGQTLSGEDWKRMRDWFGNEDNVAQWEDAMMAETGQSREEVRQTGGKMKRFYDLMDKDAKGTLTANERTEFGRLNNDRDVQRGVEVQQEMQGIRADYRVHRQATDARHDGGQDEHALARVELDKDGAPSNRFGNAPSITPIYMAAADPKPVEVKPSVAPALATQTIKVIPDNMFG